MKDLKKAIEIAGGQTALANKLKLKQAHIWNWLNRDKKVPAKHVISIEKATKGQITRHQLRPDIYPETEAA